MFFSAKFSGSLINIEKQCFCANTLCLNINWAFSKKMEACLTWEHLFMEARERRWLFPEQHLCLPSVHPSFSLWWLKKKKKWTFTEKKFSKTSYKIGSCQNNSDISNSQPCRHRGWMPWDLSKALSQADLGSNPSFNTYDSGQVAETFRAQAFSCHSFIHQILTGVSLLCSTLVKCCHLQAPGALYEDRGRRSMKMGHRGGERAQSSIHCTDSDADLDPAFCLY